MKKRTYRHVSKLVAVAMLVGLVTVPVKADNTIQDEKDKLTELNNSYNDTQNLINELDNKAADAVAYITELDAQIQNLNDNITELNEAISTKEGEIEVTKQNLERAKEDEANQYDSMKKRIQYMYENGNTSYIEIIFSSGSIEEMLNQAEYFSDITTYDREMLQKLQDTRDYIASCEVALNDEKEELENTKSQLEEQEAAVELALDAKNEELAKIQSDEEQAKALSEQLQSSIDEQENLIKELEEAERKRLEEEERKRKEQERLAALNKQNQSTSNNYSADHYDGGIFSWPIPASTRITSDYGVYESVRNNVAHNGVDIGAPTGTPILAAYSGTVVISRYSATAGNYIMIAHGDGLYSVYMHASKLLVEEGDKVTTGQQIALVGSTGNSTGPHLHFGVRVNGSYVNPWQYVSLP